MKKFKTNPLLALLFIAAMAMLSAPLIGINAAICFFGGSVIAGVFIKQLPGVLPMAVTVEIWQKDIIDNLFKNNEFALRAYNEDEYVIGGKVVHIPVAGAPTASKKNLSVFPQNAVKRSDDDVVYTLDTYYQLPKFVEKIEQYELSYDKRQSIMGEDMAQLIQDAMDGLLIRWAKKGKNMDVTGNYVLTAGPGTAEDIVTGATGQRKTLTKAAFGTIKKKMDNANILTTGRVALLTANHYQQFLDSLSDAERTNFYRYADMQKGVIGQYLGFDVIMRSSVQIWRKTVSVWAPVDTQDAGFAPNANDSAASVFYQENCASRARGEVNVFDNAGRAEYYGDVFSMNMRLGGRVRRDLGVYSVVEDIV